MHNRRVNYGHMFNSGAMGEATLDIVPDTYIVEETRRPFQRKNSYSMIQKCEGFKSWVNERDS